MMAILHQPYTSLMQPFTCVLFDTEFTAWQGSQQRRWSLPWEHRELVQLAAVKVKVDSNQTSIVGTFNEIIKPTANPILSDYIIDLTGISQSVVDAMGVDFASALEQFLQFCHDGELKAWSWGDDVDVLAENCLLNSIQMPDFSAGFGNMQKLARQLNLSGHQVSSGELAHYNDLPLSGKNHNALFDVRSMALTLNLWVAQGAIDPKDLAVVKGR